MLRLPELAPTQYDAVAMAGGYDQVTSAYQLPPGALRDCVNFACRTQGGYYRVPGYERFDGRPEPHLAGFVPIDITLDPGKTIAVGDSGDFGNLTGVVSYVDPFGRYAGITKTATLATPLTPGPIIIGGDTKGLANSYFAGITIRDLAINRAAAADIYRADIGPVPGSGPVRGVFYFNDRAFAFRDNAAGTACVLHGSSASGWQEIELGATLAFTGLTELPDIGSTISRGGVTAVVRRVAVTSGDTLADTAAGYFVIDTIAGGSFTAGAATFPGGTCMLTGPQVATTLAPGGKYRITHGNLSGTAGARRIYGADGVNDAFEFDGDVFVPIPIEGVTRKPSIARVHSDHLFLVVGGSIMHSALGDPYNYEVINGAGEIASGGEITDALVMPGNQGTAALAVFSEDSTWVLYGSTSADWRFVNFNLGIGAKPDSAQNLFEAFAFDARGMTMMRASLNYGNFDAGRITYNIRPFIHEQRARSLCSSVSRENGQYRVFFENGYGIYTTVRPDGVVGHGVVLFPHPVVCCYDGDSGSGESVSLFGTASGYVMRNDVGTSFDGANINAYLNTNINSAKSPRLRKRYRRLVLEMQGEAYVDMRVGYSFDWAAATTLPHLFVDGDAEFSGRPGWDNMFWDAFFWDGRTNDAVSVELQGSGENLQMVVVVDSNHTAEFTMSSAIFHYTPRRGNR